MKTIWQFLDSDKSQMSIQTKVAIKIIVLTGVRTGEIRLAQWHQFDFKNSLWTISPEHSKGAITVKIHLSELTKELLNQLKNISDSHHVLQDDIDNAYFKGPFTKSNQSNPKTRRYT
jgi:integrase